MYILPRYICVLDIQCTCINLNSTYVLFFFLCYRISKERVKLWRLQPSASTVAKIYLPTSWQLQIDMPVSYGSFFFLQKMIFKCVLPGLDLIKENYWSCVASSPASYPSISVLAFGVAHEKLALCHYLWYTISIANFLLFASFIKN